jgi:hypothetical protein
MFQGLAQLIGLPLTKGIQRYVNVSLDARLDIPIGLPMSNEGDAG